MVNVAGRSRGCATCRRRKVKCDELLPECLRCLSMGVKCPGARTDAFFVHTVVDASAAPATLRLKNEPALLRISADNRHPLRLPPPPPSPAQAFDQLFVSHFVDNFFGSMRPSLPVPGGSSKIWLHELPEFLASASASPVQSSIRATSMLSYGTAVGDVSIKTEACRWYTTALQGLRLLLSHEGSLGSTPESSVCAAVMLVHFETLAGTSPKAWLKHIKGAASLLEEQGPECCRTGFLHQIFSHLRLQTFVAAMADNELHPFASPQWITIPFEIHPKLLFDRLVDILFAAQRCLSIASRLITSKADQRHLLEHELGLAIQIASLQIHQWRSEALSYASRKGTQYQEVPQPVADSHLAASSDPLHFMLPYTDVASAALITLYDAANVIVLRLLCLVSPTAASHNARTQQHAESILSAHAMTKTASSSVPGRSSIMLVQQLKTVALWSPSPRQRAVAVQMLQGQTSQNRGFADISAPSNEYFAHVAAHILENYSVD